MSIKSNIKSISPSFLTGSLLVPPSKSYTHRALICAFLASGKSIIKNTLNSEDIDETIKEIEKQKQPQEEFPKINGVEEIKTGEEKREDNKNDEVLDIF